MREMQADSGFQVRQLLAESVCESSKTTQLHSHRKVLSLNKTGGNVVRVGVALTYLGYNPRDAWWGIPRIGRIKLPEVAC
jgi:hypothetical protein